MRKLLFILITITSIMLLTGCWNYREINTTIIVAGVAIDKNNDGSYHLTSEVINIGGSPNESKLISKRIEADGNSLFEAIRNMIKLSGRRLFWSHSKVVIVSEEVAKEGILPIMDFFARNDELRLSAFLVVSKGESAKEILSQEGITDKIISYTIVGIIEEHVSNITINNVNLKEFINYYNSDASAGTLATIHVVDNDNKKSVKIEGSSVFKEDKFIDYLNSNHTRSYLFIKDEVKKGVYPIKVSSPEGETDYITIEIMESKTKIEPTYKEDKLSIHVKLKTKIAIAELGFIKNILDEKDRMELKKIIEEQFEKDISNTIQLLQNEYGLDIFGFGTKVKANLPSLWKEIGDEWEVHFKQLNVKVKAEIEITNTSFLIKDIKGE